MNVRQLQIFAEVAKHNSFSKAAQSLHMAQPAVSIAIKKLENEMDTIILNRGSNNISLTTEETILLAHAEKILNQMSEAKLEMNEFKGLQKGEVSIAMPAMHAAYHFPGIFSDFMLHYPKLHICVKEEGTDEIEQDLLNSDIDLGIVIADEASDELEVHPLCLSAANRAFVGFTLESNKR